MKNSNVFIPIIITIFLVVSSFIPIFQILILTLNGGIISIFENVLKLQSKNMAIVFNAVMSFLCLSWFFKQKSNGLIMSNILAVNFLLPMFILVFEGKINGDVYYFLPLMVSGLLTGLILISIGLLKSKANIKPSN